MFRIAVMLILSLLASTAGAAQNWFIKNAEIERVSVFYDGYYHGFHLYFRADARHVDEPALASRCPTTWEQGATLAHENKVVSWWSRGEPDAVTQLMYATALAAQAQGLKIDLRVDVGNCMDEPGRQWGYKWYGASLAGH